MKKIFIIKDDDNYIKCVITYHIYEFGIQGKIWINNGNDDIETRMDYPEDIFIDLSYIGCWSDYINVDQMYNSDFNFYKRIIDISFKIIGDYYIDSNEYMIDKDKEKKEFYEEYDLI